jgi:phospholipase C
MYFAGAHYRFSDNDHIPAVAVGRRSGGGPLCVDLPSPLNCIANAPMTYPKETIAGLLLDAGKTFAVYADGYGEALAAANAGSCPSNPSSCRYSSCLAHPVACFGCVYDPSDIPFLYFARFADAPTPTPFMKDYETDFAVDLAEGRLPSFAFVKARVWHNEHPNYSNIADGVAFVKATLAAIAASPMAASTLVLLTWDEGGGFFDHVTPPAAPPAMADSDDTGNPVPYGTRVPLLAIGPFARAGSVSHVEMEHSSIVRFLEWNFLTFTGQLGARDGWVANLGSLLDPTKTGVPVP